LTFPERVTALERSAAQHDKQIKAIRDLVHEGMRLMVETRKEMRALATAQKRTEESLRAFLEGRRGGNGHAKRKVDLQ
jgi:uncharacterized coiled-coil protein SlyX